jgi:hypothetical protein
MIREIIPHHIFWVYRDDLNNTIKYLETTINGYSLFNILVKQVKAQ